MIRKKKRLYSFITVAALMISMTTSLTNIKSVAAAESKIRVEKGTDISEFDTIQQAIDSVLDNESAVISVPAGSYDEAIAITNTKGKVNRSIVLKGAQAGNSAVVDGEKRTETETILTNGIAINGLHEDASITIDGFTLNNKGINIQGWGNLIDSTGNIRIINNVITDVANGSVSAIHVNTNADTEFIGTFEASNNYIAKIGQADNAANGIYFTISADVMNIKDNVIRDVNHTCINFASASIKNEATITGNVIANWNRDGESGSGALGSQGDGIYITKTNTPNTIPIHIHHNRITREETLPGNKGYATRCANNKGKIDLSENYWATEFPLTVISGGTYANVTISSICDEAMTVKDQSIGLFSFSASELYVTGKYNERKLSATVTMLDKTIEKPEVVFTTDTPELITLDTRDDGTYYVAKQAGAGKLIATVTDPVSKQEYKLEKEVLVKDIELKDQTIELDQTVQMIYELLPKGEVLPALSTVEWVSFNEDIATIDENGLVTSTGKEGSAEIELTIKRLGTVLYQTTATVTVKSPIVNTPPLIDAADKVLNVNDSFDPLKGITAFDNEDGDLTAVIQVISNNVDTKQAGTYEVTYQVTDSEGASVTKTITVIVKDIETVQISVAAIIEGKTGMIAAEYEYVKGYEIDSEGMLELNSLIESLQATADFEGYECQGLFLDKEGKKTLELGYQFNEATLIYMLWNEVEIEDKPIVEPPKPEKPIEPQKPADTDSKPSKLPQDTKSENDAALNKSEGVQTGDSTAFTQYASILGIIVISFAIYYTFDKKKKTNNSISL